MYFALLSFNIKFWTLNCFIYIEYKHENNHKIVQFYLFHLHIFQFLCTVVNKISTTIQQTKNIRILHCFFLTSTFVVCMLNTNGNAFNLIYCFGILQFFLSIVNSKLKVFFECLKEDVKDVFVTNKVIRKLSFCLPILNKIFTFCNKRK